MVRLRADSPLDSDYGQAGRKLVDVGGPNDSIFGVALSPDAMADLDGTLDRRRQSGLL
jgi:hypothetical protein